ncbi:hypothetical protein LINPERPRIM_LOCUS4509 [Linum perenne]
MWRHRPKSTPRPDGNVRSGSLVSLLVLKNHVTICAKGVGVKRLLVYVKF